MNLSLVKEIVLDLVQRHHDADGLGPDPYQPAPMRHAMAEGKLLAAVAELAESRVLGAQQVETIAAASLERLGELQIETDHGAGFGLGFGWRGVPADTPFTITTAIVTDGLDRIASVMRKPGPASDLATATKAWLTSDEILDTETGLPQYSPVFTDVIINVVGFWAHALRGSHPEFAAVGRRYVEQTFLPGIGWPYVPGEGRLDLLHTCYSAHALLDQPDAARQIATAVSRFVSPTGLFDKVDVMSLDDAEGAATRATSTCITVDATHAYVLHTAPARLWSIGELLTICSRRPGTDTLNGFWRSVAIRAVDQLGSMDLTAEGPRHTMHVAHGLASHLAAERSRNE